MDTMMIMVRTERNDKLPWRVRVYYSNGDWVVNSRPNAAKLKGTTIDKYMVGHRNGYGIATYGDLDVAKDVCDAIARAAPKSFLLPNGRVEPTKKNKRFYHKIIRIVKNTDGLCPY